MRALSSFELLDVWDRGAGEQPAVRALMLLAAACPETPLDMLTQLTVGQRDARLLKLREATLGNRLVGLAACPACDERVELSFNVTDIIADVEAETPEKFTLKLDGYELSFRLPNAGDLMDISSSDDFRAARQTLFERCVLAASSESGRRRPKNLPARVAAAAAAKMSEADPHADIQFSLGCSACGHRWQAVFDIVSFFWAEISAWAHRTLNEVHTLALAYGWREADILAMSAWRRQAYLEMVSV